jgi:predicted transcriptional regulator
MSTLSVRLPNSLHKQLRELAKQEGVSMNQFISAAVGEKLAALMTLEYLEERAERGSHKRFNAVLKRVSAQEPEELDRLPPKKRRKRH